LSALTYVRTDKRSADRGVVDRSPDVRVRTDHAGLIRKELPLAGLVGATVIVYAREMLLVPN
jgi:hypothetical protein